MRTKHWTNTISDMDHHESFTTFAVEWDLSLHAHQALHEAADVELQEHATSLMKYTTTKQAVTYGLPFSPTATELLLKLGRSQSEEQ